jgi:superfamily II DNA helicase RecQ
MQIKIFSVPIPFSETANEELNAFLRSKKVLKIDEEVVSDSGGTYWVFCVHYIIDGIAPDYGEREKVDYKKVLDVATFQRFSRMREIRKQLAAEDDVPAFAIFKDFELAELAALPEITLQAMKKIKGIGTKRVDKYGEKLIQAFSDETNRPSDADNPQS